MDLEKKRDLMLYISVLEDELPDQMKLFEDAVRERWSKLPNLESDILYHYCHYFGDGYPNEIQSFFEAGIMRVANWVELKFRAFSGLTSEIKYWWQYIYKERIYKESEEPMYDLLYSDAEDDEETIYDLLDRYCKPFEKAFDAVAEGSSFRLRAAREKFEQLASSPDYGYISNSFTFALIMETFDAINTAVRSVKSENKAWSQAIEPQRAIHEKLSRLWEERFETVFMPFVQTINAEASVRIIQTLICLSPLSYNDYLDMKNEPSFEEEKEKFAARIDKERVKQEAKNEEKRKQLLLQLNAEFDAINARLTEIGWLSIGAKHKEKKDLKKRKASLFIEIQATEELRQLPRTYTVVFPSDSDEHCNVSGVIRQGGFNEKSWEICYDCDNREYVVYSWERQPLFSLRGEFLRTYGHGRHFYGHPVECLDFIDLKEVRVSVILYEVK